MVEIAKFINKRQCLGCLAYTIGEPTRCHECGCMLVDEANDDDIREANERYTKASQKKVREGMEQNEED